MRECGEVRGGRGGCLGGAWALLLRGGGWLGVVLWGVGDSLCIIVIF